MGYLMLRRLSRRTSNSERPWKGGRSDWQLSPGRIHSTENQQSGQYSLRNLWRGGRICYRAAHRRKEFWDGHSERRSPYHFSTLEGASPVPGSLFPLQRMRASPCGFRGTRSNDQYVIRDFCHHFHMLKVASTTTTIVTEYCCLAADCLNLSTIHVILCRRHFQLTNFQTIFRIK